MTDRVCSVEGCERKHDARGYCSRHYYRWRKNGDALSPVTIERYSTPEESFRARTTANGDCIEWTGYIDVRGYGHISAGGSMTLAHRWVYMQRHGELPSTTEVDHICHNTRCVNIDHLRAATRPQNAWNLDGAHCDSATGIRGLSRKDYGRWDARVTCRGMTTRRSFPSDKKDQAVAWLESTRKELFGDYSGA